MKKLLFVLFMLAAMNVSAQTETIDQTDDKLYPVYCDLMTYNYFVIDRLKVRLDMGVNTFETIRDAKGKTKKFNSTIEAVNYMAKYGWKVKSTYIMHESPDKEVLHYLLYKMVKNDEEIYDGLKAEE